MNALFVGIEFVTPAVPLFSVAVTVMLLPGVPPPIVINTWRLASAASFTNALGAPVIETVRAPPAPPPVPQNPEPSGLSLLQVPPPGLGQQKPLKQEVVEQPFMLQVLPIWQELDMQSICRLTPVYGV